MLAEECGLNEYLEDKGIEVVESDLGERILQLMHKRPSHIVLPAIHIRKEEIGELFVKEMGTEPGNNDQTYLTHAARKNLRHKFIEAEAAMTGANFAVASTGECVVCTNEGMPDMGTSQPKLQIYGFRYGKDCSRPGGTGSVHPFAGTFGYGTADYNLHFSLSQAEKGGELHIIIVDNGRSQILADKEHVKTLNCLRCGACMNTCPVYRRSGGYSYTYFIPGPIGINLGMLKAPLHYYDNVSACSLCHSCQNVCPAKVDLADQIYCWRQQLQRLGVASTPKHVMSEGMKFLMERPGLFDWA